MPMEKSPHGAPHATGVTYVWSLHGTKAANFFNLNGERCRVPCQSSKREHQAGCCRYANHHPVEHRWAAADKHRTDVLVELGCKEASSAPHAALRLNRDFSRDTRRLHTRQVARFPSSRRAFPVEYVAACWSLHTIQQSLITLDMKTSIG